MKTDLPQPIRCRRPPFLLRVHPGASAVPSIALALQAAHVPRGRARKRRTSSAIRCAFPALLARHHDGGGRPAPSACSQLLWEGARALVVGRRVRGNTSCIHAGGTMGGALLHDARAQRRCPAMIGIRQASRAAQHAGGAFENDARPRRPPAQDADERPRRDVKRRRRHRGQRNASLPAAHPPPVTRPAMRIGTPERRAQSTVSARQDLSGQAADYTGS